MLASTLSLINIVFQCIFIKLDVSYASQHTFSQVTVTILKNYTYIVNNRGLEPRLRKKNDLQQYVSRHNEK